MNRDESLTEIIREYLQQDSLELPVYESTFLNIHQEVGKETPDVKVIEEIIVCDAALTAEVLRIANSSFYRGIHKISTIKDAILRLGMNEIINLSSLVSQRKYFRCSHPFIKGLMDKLWQHSVACAAGSKWLAKACNSRAILSEVFFAGLLHDIGKLYLLTSLEHIKREWRMDGDVKDETVNEALTVLHTDYGYLHLQKWNIPEIYCQVVRDHHRESYDPGNDLLTITRLVNQACQKIGIGLREDASILLGLLPEANLLGATDMMLAELQIVLEDSVNFAGFLEKS
jgi:HD-like signal output (HDOD) protein